MPRGKKLYIDSDGVQRGFYVYIHKDRVTGKVFYVGKGHGNRAWVSHADNDKWRERVASLVDGWEVEIVEQDLSEIEAFDLEAEVVEKHGGCEAGGGKLTNFLPGGENSLSIKIGFHFDDGGLFKAYDDARVFKEFGRDVEENLVKDFNKELDPIRRKVDDLESEAVEATDEKLEDSLTELASVLGGIRDDARDFLRRRISWKAFALALEDAVDDLELEVEESRSYDMRVKPLIKQALKITANFLSAIDSGNRKEADEIARRMVDKGEK